MRLMDWGAKENCFVGGFTSDDKSMAKLVLKAKALYKNLWGVN